MQQLTRRRFLEIGATSALGALGACAPGIVPGAERRLLYVATPGIRNYLEFGGMGVIVYDSDDSYRFLRRIPVWEGVPGVAPENVKGICASAETGRLYVSTIKRLACVDLGSDRVLWDRAYPNGCDRMALSPDGRTMYLPSLEGPDWLVLDALSGDPIARIVLNSRAHNTVYGPDGRFVYMAGLGSPLLSVADTSTHRVVRQVGPFSHAIRPFTVNGSQTLAFVNVNDLLGFEIGDIRSGRKLHRVEVEGFRKGPVRRHGCPSHGIGLTPDEREVWVVDGPNSHVHVFDATTMPPRQVASIPLREQPGWVSFDLSGHRALLSTGEIIEVASRRVVATLSDEAGWPVGSEKMLEIAFRGGRATRAGDQFGIGQRR